MVKKPKITWSVEKRKLADLKPHEKNPRNFTEKGMKDLEKSINSIGFMQPININIDGTILSGHARAMKLKEMGETEVDVYVPSSALSLKQEEEVLIRANANTAGVWDFDKLANEFELPELTDWGLEIPNVETLEIEETVNDDDVSEPPVKAITVKGDLYELGKHRILCGDSTMIDDVQKLMNGKKSLLLHADPPYGMGKEKDGVLNDNLYKEDLDKFQMDWWLSFRPFLESSSSAYIWGNAPDLWRLWYCGGLEKSEELQFCNHIVWDKKCIPGMKSDLMTQYPIASEHCLFFKLGNQLKGSINTEDYWEGWDEIRIPLAEEAKRVGLTAKLTKEICGCDMYSHWFTKSQWSLISEKHYNALANHFKTGFQTPWKEIKKIHLELLKGAGADKKGQRSYFDNAHESMIDVWQYDRVRGEERQGHATPKPVEMVVRIVKSSSPVGAIVLEPFLGSGSTLIGCEKAKRACYGMELDEKYCDVIVKRYIKFCKSNNKIPTVKRNGEDCLKEFEND